MARLLSLVSQVEEGAEALAGEGETLDSICGGTVRILQRARGYRFNLDPVLLAHFAHASGRGLRGRAMDLGTGSGIIPLLLARKFGTGDLTGLELQPSLRRLAERNVELNAAQGRIRIVQGDLRKVRSIFPAGAFSHVLCNPPYGRVHDGQLNPSVEKAVARHELCCSLDDVGAAAAYLLRDGGSLWLVYPAPRLMDLLGALADHRLAPRRFQLVYPFSDEKARLALLQAVKGRRNQITVCAPLWLHERGRPGFSAEVASMLEGS
jgi:tRNA1(Val) A37 N6-methylase TrmN6